MIFESISFWDSSNPLKLVKFLILIGSLIYLMNLPSNSKSSLDI
jgi:hypothetical protein